MSEKEWVQKFDNGRNTDQGLDVAMRWGESNKSRHDKIVGEKRQNGHGKKTNEPLDDRMKYNKLKKIEKWV